MTGDAELLEKARRQFFRAEWLHDGGGSYGVMAAGESPILLVPVGESTRTLTPGGIAGWLDLVSNTASFYVDALVKRAPRRVLLVETVEFAKRLLEDESIASWSILALDGAYFRWVRS